MSDNNQWIPLTGGNTFATREKYKAYENKSIDQRNVWLLYLKTHDYFTNYFKVEGDEEFKKVAPLFFSNLWNYGQVAIVKWQEKFVILTVTATKTNGQGEIIKGNGYIANWLTGQNGMVEIGQPPKQAGQRYILNNIDYAYARWGNIGLPAWFFWQAILEKQVQILNACYTNISWLAKKMKYEVFGGLTDETNYEIDHSLDPRSGVIVEVKQGKDKMGIPKTNFSKFTELNLPNGSSGADAWDYMSRYENFWNKYMGRVSHNYEKSSHNISNEMEVNNHNYIILEQDVLRQLEICSMQLKERLGVNVTFSPTVDLTAMDSEERKGDPGDDGHSTEIE